MTQRLQIAALLSSSKRSTAIVGALFFFLIGGIELSAQGTKPTTRPQSPPETRPQSQPQKSAPVRDERAKKLIEAHIKAIGGRKPFAKLTTRVQKTNVQMLNTDFRGSYELFESRPGKHYMVMDFIDGKGTHIAQESGSDGKQGWENDTMNGFRMLPKDLAAMQRTELHFDSILNWEREYLSWRYIGLLTRKGKTCEAVALEMPYGGQRIWAFERATGLRIYIKSIENKGTKQERSIDQDISDYREVEGIKSPFLIEVKEGQSGFRYETKHLRYGIKIDPEKFVIPDPEDAKKLQDKKKPTTRKSK